MRERFSGILAIIIAIVALISGSEASAPAERLAAVKGYYCPSCHNDTLEVHSYGDPEYHHGKCFYPNCENRGRSIRYEHVRQKVQRKEATCTQPGHEAGVICGMCGQTLEGKTTIPALGHKWIECDRTEPTCEKTGIIKYRCDRCGDTRQDTLKELGHDWKTEEEVKPTCTEKGWKIEYCARSHCTAVRKEEYQPTGHDCKWVVEDKPTCTKEGKERLVCQKCKRILEKRTIQPKGHRLKETIVEPTCMKEGLKITTCENEGCSYREEEILKKAEHKYGQWKITRQPTCTAEGMQERECVWCGTKETEIIPVKEHSYGEWKIIKPAACVEAGVRERECKVCGKSQKEEIPPTGHSYGDWKTVRKPTCTDVGLRTRTCRKCGQETEDVIPATGHSYGDWKIIKKATCTDGGIRKRTCRNCGEAIEEAIPPTGHNYGEWKTEKKPTCTEKGARKRVCRTCGEEIKEDVPALGHDYREKNRKQPTCTQNGSVTKVCTRCGDKKTTTLKAVHNYIDIPIGSYIFTVCTKCFDVSVEPIIAEDTDSIKARVMKAVNSLIRESVEYLYGREIDQNTRFIPVEIADHFYEICINDTPEGSDTVTRIPLRLYVIAPLKNGKIIPQKGTRSYLIPVKADDREWIEKHVALLITEGDSIEPLDCVVTDKGAEFKTDKVGGVAVLNIQDLKTRIEDELAGYSSL